MSYEKYNEIPALNWSLLRELAVSPLQFAWRREHPQAETDAMRMGRAVHTAVLEPDRFPLEYVVFSGPRRAGKDWEAFAAANRDKTILKSDDYENCLRIRDAVRGNRDAARLLDGEGSRVRSDTELSVKWERDGVQCKGRVDILTSLPSLADLKTTRDLSRFESTVARYLYHGQMAWYADGIKATGWTYPDCYLIAAQSVAPFDVVVYQLTDETMAAGRAVVDRLFRLYQECTESGEWPGLGADGVRELRLPSWATSADSDELTLNIGGEDYAL